MKNKKQLMFLLRTLLVILTAAVYLPGVISAGDLEPPPGAVNGSGNPVSTMVTLDDIYTAVVYGNAAVEKTGQTTCYDTTWLEIPCSGTGQDGELQKGVPWPNPRFSDNLDGTVTDNLTKLIWLKNADCFGLQEWSVALTNCNTLASGSCELTDDSSVGDWRLPNIKELQSLTDYGKYAPALPAGYSSYFTNVRSGGYWSSTTNVAAPAHAWSVDLNQGYVGNLSKTGSNYYGWPVRGGN